MAKKAYPLRINEEILSAMQHWSDDELRSLNAQINTCCEMHYEKQVEVSLNQ